MYFVKLEEFFWRHRRLASLLIIIAIIQVFELLLLHYKYNIFTGGFLQPVHYQNFTERAGFILVSLWFDILFFGFFSVIWFYIADKLQKHGIYIYYAFTVSTMLIMGGWLGLKFKVLSYFNDTLNFLIIKNLAGGSLKQAMLYASNEIFLIASTVLAIIVLFFLGFKFLKRFKYVRSFPAKKGQVSKFSALLLFLILATPIITILVLNNPSLRYGLQKKTSFNIISKILDKISDIDSDGYGSFTFPRDQAILNPDIYPKAIDIPENEIDEDGFLGDAEFPPVVVDSFTEIVPAKGKNIVLIVLESARVDSLEMQINGQYVAPVLRSIAKKGTVVANAYSHTGYTTTSLKAIFNRNLIGRQSDNLINFLRRSGYQISIISGQDESFGRVASKVGMKQVGVSYFDARTAIEDRVFVSKEAGSLRLSEERVVEQFKVRVSQLDFSQPQFIYLNFQAAHFPYSHPKMAKRIIKDFIPRSDINFKNQRQVAETYWNAIANADWAVGQVMQQLIQYKVMDNTTLVILGDHGESLFDDGFLGHGHAVNDAQTKIPLIFNDPHIKINQAIGQVDVAEMMVRSALGIENNWLKSDKPVFQLVGNLAQPSLIAHVKIGEGRTVFDFRSEQVFFSQDKAWLDYREALKNPNYKNRVESLIKDWENLRWLALQERKANSHSGTHSQVQVHSH